MVRPPQAELRSARFHNDARVNANMQVALLILERISNPGADRAFQGRGPSDHMTPYHELFARSAEGSARMNDNEATVPQQIAHLEAMASTMREDMEEARAGLLAKPGDERLAKQVSALEGLLKGG